MQTLTLVFHPDVDDPAVQAARSRLLGDRAERRLLDRLGATIEARRELSELACDIDFTGPPAAAALEDLRSELAEAAVDFCVQPAAGRQKRLLVADMESTVIENEMLDELAEMVGVGERVATITARAMNGELDFRQALSERVGLLAGVDAELLTRAQSRIRIDPGAAALVRTLKDAGVITALVSGGFMIFAERIAQRLGFDHCQANRLEINGGRLTGRVLEPILDRDAKVSALEALCTQNDLRKHEAATIGDGANDLSMLRAAGLGVAFHGKPAVAKAAPQRIDVGDLSTLLYFMGYPAHRWSH